MSDRRNFIRSPEGGIAVLIAKHPCIVNRAARKEQAVLAMSITDDCVGCRVCIDTFECPAILFAGGEDRARIDQNRCIGCGVCVHVCPAGAIRAEGEKP